MNEIVNPLRHLAVFDPGVWGQRRVDVIGAGATGSRIVIGLAKLGIRVIHVWDFDKVEAHNVANQAFGLKDIGRLKVEALHDRVLADTGIDIVVHNQKVDGTQPLGEVVFLLTDSMESRRLIFAKGIKNKIGIKLLVETRMGVDLGRVYVLDPRKPALVREYEKTLSTEIVAQKSACGTSITVGPTAEIISGLAVFQLIRFFNIERKVTTPADELENEIIFALRPTTGVMTNTWK